MINCSVAISVYNGEKNIYNQLKSILRQSYIPQEVIIVDDNSSDKSAFIIEEFITKFQLRNWKLIRNKKNKGYPQNIYYTIFQCKGDYIFLCDQDDIWNENKILEMIKILKSSKESIYLLSTEANYVYKDKIVRRARNDKTFFYNTCSNIFNGKNYLGMCMCINKKLLKFLPQVVLNTKIPHDLLLDLLASSMNKSIHYNCLTADHIIHQNNFSIRENNVSNPFNYDLKLNDIQNYFNIMCEFKKVIDVFSINISSIILKKYEVSNKRLIYFRNKSIIKLIELFCTEYKMYQLKSLIKDIVIILLSRKNRLFYES